MGVKVTVSVYKVAAQSQVELEMNAEEAQKKALEMARTHTVVMKPPQEDFVAIIEKASNY